MHVTENGTGSEMTRTGDRTSTPTVFPAVSERAVTATRACFFRPPPAGKDRVRHPGPGTEPCARIHR